MHGVSIMKHTEGDTLLFLTVEHIGGPKHGQKLKVQIGSEHIVQPSNPRKLKHHGRRCTVVDWVRDDIGTIVSVAVRFADNGRRGRVPLADLANPVAVAVVQRHDALTGADPRHESAVRRMEQFLSDPALQNPEEARLIGADPLVKDLMRTHPANSTLQAFLRRYNDLQRSAVVQTLKQRLELH